MQTKNDTFSKNTDYKKKDSKEHILIQIWDNREHGEKSIDELVKRTKEANPLELIDELSGEGLVVIESGQVLFTQQGEKYAENIIRRHRLAEVLLSEVLSVDDKSARSQVCEFEHILTPDVTDSICTFLGHPSYCPHGMPIPRGECCATFKRDVGPLIRPLIDMKIGESGKIVFMSPKTHFRLDRLMSFGIAPGSIIKLHQKKPSIVVQIGETDLALDYEIAKNIYVRHANEKG